MFGIFITQIDPDTVLMNVFFDLGFHNTQYSLNGATGFRCNSHEAQRELHTLFWDSLISTFGDVTPLSFHSAIASWDNRGAWDKRGADYTFEICTLILILDFNNVVTVFISGMTLRVRGPGMRCGIIM